MYKINYKNQSPHYSKYLCILIGLLLKSIEIHGLDAFDSLEKDGNNISILWIPNPKAGSYYSDFRIGQTKISHNASFML